VELPAVKLQQRRGGGEREEALRAATNRDRGIGRQRRGRTREEGVPDVLKSIMRDRCI
jgi:hypothetical protein